MILNDEKTNLEGEFLNPGLGLDTRAKCAFISSPYCLEDQAVIGEIDDISELGFLIVEGENLTEKNEQNMIERRSDVSRYPVKATLPKAQRSN
ncbi:MAG: hypothetical protein ACOYIS_02260 [Candidatus Cloacimonadaceae bacterium]|jgi:hypothetical protein